MGNHTRVLVSDLGGRAGMAMKARELGVELDDRAAGALSDELKRLESKGWLFEAADASLELLMRRAAGWSHEFFEVEAYRVSSYHREGPVTREDAVEISVEATVKLWVDGVRVAAVGEGNGPGQRPRRRGAAPRSRPRTPRSSRIHLTDFKVRVLDGGSATGAVVRVLIDSTDGENVWTTVGVDTNVIEASWQALVDSLVYGLLHTGGLESPPMAAPEYVPRSPTDEPRVYHSPPWSGEPWLADRPGELLGRQPLGPRLGYPGPDQGFVLKLANAFEPKLVLVEGESAHDAIVGCTAVGAQAGVAVRTGPGGARPHGRLHHLGLPGHRRRRAPAPAPPAVRRGGQPPPLHGAAPDRRPGAPGRAAPEPPRDRQGGRHRLARLLQAAHTHFLTAWLPDRLTS